LFLLLIAFSDETPIPHQELSLQITTGVEEIELGKAFPLMVKRTWSKELVPGEWLDEQLSPLHVRLVEASLRENDSHVEETLDYSCHAFSLEDMVIPPPSFRAWPKDGGSERVTSADEILIRVKPLLNPDAPGPAELPCGLLPVPTPFSWLPWLGGGAMVLATLALLWYVQQHARRRAAMRVEPAPPPGLRALERLERLRGQDPAGASEIDAYYVEASSLVREYIVERFNVRAPEMTTEQFLASRETARALEASQCNLLAEFLAQCDLVKFGRHMPTDPDRVKLLDAAERFLTETQAGDTAETIETTLQAGGVTS
jgi:hypothetical protein